MITTNITDFTTSDADVSVDDLSEDVQQVGDGVAVDVGVDVASGASSHYVAYSVRTGSTTAA